jgi:protein-S-isoprenylcysteine O-methyltransferase Ste14
MRGEAMREKNGEHPWGDAGQIILLGVFLVVWAGDSFFLHESILFSSYVPLSARLIVLGIALVAGLALFRVTHPVVCREQRPDKVVATGPFRYVRHPLYLSAVVTYIGVCVSTMSIYAFVVFVGIMVFYDYIAGYEERLLEIKFGEEYRQYKNATGKWIPATGKGV